MIVTGDVAAVRDPQVSHRGPFSATAFVAIPSVAEGQPVHEAGHAAPVTLALVGCAWFRRHLDNLLNPGMRLQSLAQDPFTHAFPSSKVKVMLRGVAA